MQQCTGSQRGSFLRISGLRLGRASGSHLVHSPLGVKLRCFFLTDVQASPFPAFVPRGICQPSDEFWQITSNWTWAHLKKVFQENFWSLFKFLLDLSLGVHIQINWIYPLIQYFMLEGKWIRRLNFQKWRRFPNCPYQAGHRARFLHTNTVHCLISLHHRYSPHFLNYCRYAKHTKMHKKETGYKYGQETKRTMG